MSNEYRPWINLLLRTGPGRLLLRILLFTLFPVLHLAVGVWNGAKEAWTETLPLDIAAGLYALRNAKKEDK